MSDVVNEHFAKPQLVDVPNSQLASGIPAWLQRAMELYADHSIANDEFDLRGQYAENRMFLQRIEREIKEGKISATDLRDMEIAFAKACADPEGDPMIEVEAVYLKSYYARQPKRRNLPSMQVGAQVQAP